MSSERTSSIQSSKSVEERERGNRTETSEDGSETGDLREDLPKNFEESVGEELGEEPDIDINDFFEHIGLNKELKFTEKTMREFEEDIDFENTTPKNRIVFVPAKRFSNFGYHYLLETYVPFTVDLSCMSLLALDGIEFMFFLTYVNAGKNLLSTEGLQYIEYLDDLIALIADKNKLTYLKVPKLQELMYLDVSENEITHIDPSLKLPALETLMLNYNQLNDIMILGRDHLPKLTFLSVTNNFVKDLHIPWSRHLTLLFLGNNEIRETSGLSGLYKLRTLHLRENHISSLTEFPADLVSLDYLNLRANQITEMSSLERLANLPNLKTLIIKGNACTFQGEGEEDYRIQVLSYLPTLKRIDKIRVTQEELDKAAIMKKMFSARDDEEEAGEYDDA